MEADLMEIRRTVDLQEKNENTTVRVNTETSIADEIKKSKELLDQGVLTEEEFTEIKKKLIEKYGK